MGFELIFDLKNGYFWIGKMKMDGLWAVFGQQKVGISQKMNGIIQCKRWIGWVLEGIMGIGKMKMD